MKKITTTALLSVTIATILTNSYVYSMVSVGHFKTGQQQQVLLFGESQDLDADIQKPGYAAQLIDSILTILKNVTFKQRIAVLTEMEPNFFKTQNETSRLSPLATSLTTLYRGMLEKGRSPWVLTMEDRRGAESDYMNCMLGFIESKIQAGFESDLLMGYLTDPAHFKDKKNSGHAFAKKMSTTKITSRKPVTLGEYLSSLEVENNYISSLCKKWADEPKLAPFLAKALRSHTKAKDSLLKLFENCDKQSDLWLPLRDLFAQKTEFVEIVSTAKYVMKLHRKTDFQFCALCLVDRLFDFFREGQTMVVIFGGQTHALYLTKLFKTALQWESVKDISCLSLGDLSLKAYTFPANYQNTVTEITQNCMASHAVDMLNNVNTPQCFYCLNTSSTPLSKCAKCNFAEYCCKECQVKAWPEHKKLCGKNTL